VRRSGPAGTRRGRAGLFGPFPACSTRTRGGSRVTLRAAACHPPHARRERGGQSANAAPPLEMRWRRRRARASRTASRAAVAGIATAALAAAEVLHVWRRGGAPNSARPCELLRGGEIAARETVDVLRAGYSSGTANETAVLTPRPRGWSIFVPAGAKGGRSRVRRRPAVARVTAPSAAAGRSRRRLATRAARRWRRRAARPPRARSRRGAAGVASRARSGPPPPRVR
jgi:hypothetical protein